MTYRVFVSDNFAFDGVDIVVGQESMGDINNPPRRLILHMGEGGSPYWDEYESSTIAVPTLKVDEGAARALMEALVHHFHGADDARALRKDYDDERYRVDKLTDVICQLAARPQDVHLHKAES